MRSNLAVLIAFALGVALILTGALLQRSRRADDAPKTRAQLSDLCDDGDGASCYELGLKWGNGVDGPTDADKARQYVERACDLEHQKACDFLPMMK